MEERTPQADGTVGARGAAWWAERLLWFYIAVSALSLSSVGLIGSLAGWDELAPYWTRPGPLTDRELAWLTVVSTWLLIGAVLAAAARGALRRETAVFGVGWLLTALQYINFVRERVEFGDVIDYVAAARNLLLGEPFHARYLYPPFWATLLQPLAPYGERTIFLACMAGNIAAVILFYPLLVLVLRRYGFSLNLASLASFVLLIVNVPLLRTLGWVQTNLHVCNLVLLCLLLHRTRWIASAVALGAAVHLKVAPLVLVLPFGLARRWRWCAAFAAAVLAIVAWTSAMNDFDYYASFARNIADVRQANTGVTFRENSIDSLFHSVLTIGTNRPRPEQLASARTLAALVKAAVALLGLWLLFASIRNRSFYTGGDRGDEIVYNGFPVLLFVMVAVSPLIWVHHLVLLAFPFVLLLKRLRRGADVALYVAAYASLFLMPTFDVFPFSFHRLLALAACFALLVRFQRQPAGPSPIFLTLDERAHRLTEPPFEEARSTAGAAQ